MKRKNILIVLLVVLAAVFMPKKVFAANCDLTQAHVFTGDGESTCTLQADLELDSSISISSGTVNIDLNGHNFTMTGSGEAIRVTGTGSLNISGEGTISTGPGTANSPAYSALIFDSTGNLTISGGTFENGIHAQNASSVTIENGTFNGNYAAGFSSIGNLVINNGTFNGTHCGATFSNNASQRINGGTFQGGTFGILINDDNVKPLLYGGTYKSTNNDSYAIVINSKEEDNGFFNKLVGDNYHYSEKFNVLRKNVSDYSIGRGSSSGPVEDVVYYFYVSDSKNVSVVAGAPSENQKIAPYTESEEESTEANPKTGSILYIYVIAFLLVSGLAVFGTYSYRKQLNK